MLEAPQRFKDGLNKKVSTVYPIVVIQKGDDIIRLSQKKGMFDGEYYEDRGLKVSSIKEAIDITDKNFKTNQITINLSNYIYNNERFSDKFNSFTFVNAEASIYYSNANCKSLDDCLLIFKGFIKDFSGGKDKISLKIEDHSEYVLEDKNLPRYKTYDAAEESIEKSKNAFFPITYGHNEKAPLIFTRSNRVNTISQIFADSIFRDDIEIEGFQKNDVEDEFDNLDHCLSVFRDDQYHKVPNKIVGLPPGTVVNGIDYGNSIVGYNDTLQYSFSENDDIVVLNKKKQDDTQSFQLRPSLQSREQLLCESKRKVTAASVDSSGDLDWGTGVDSSLYMGPTQGYDIVEITEPDSDENIFQFPEVSNPAIFVEQGFYKNVYIGGFWWRYFKDTYNFPYPKTIMTNSAVYYIAWTLSEISDASTDGQTGIDFIYKPDISEIEPFLQNQDYDELIWFQGNDITINNSADSEGYWWNPRFSYWTAQSLGFVPDLSPNDEQDNQGTTRSWNGLKFTIDGDEYFVGLDDDASQYFKPEVYEWITEEGTTPTLRKILWGRRVYYGQDGLADETGGIFNAGAWVYGLFPVLGYSRLRNAYYDLIEADVQAVWTDYTYETKMMFDCLYCFKNPYLIDPENTSNIQTENLSKFEIESIDFSKLIPTPHYSSGSNEDVPIINSEEFWFEGPDLTAESYGNIGYSGGNWCPIHWNEGQMQKVKINLTFNSISGDEVLEGGVFSRMRGKLDVNFAKTASDDTITSSTAFSAKLDALKDDDNLFVVRPSLLPLNTFSDVDLEPSSYETYEISPIDPLGGTSQITEDDLDPNDTSYLFTECNRYLGEESNPWRQGLNSVNYASLIFVLRTNDASGASNFVQGHFNAIISNFELFQKFIIGNISKQKYFGNVKGRLDDALGTYTGVESPNSLIERPTDILIHIMEKELNYFNTQGFDQDSLDIAREFHPDWKFAFSVNEEIESKEFVKDFSKSSKFIPRFRHDGTLSFVNIPESYSIVFSEISSSDVISFKYSKTPVSDVKLMVQVNYKYDLGLEDYQACTNKNNGGAVPQDYSNLMDYYGIKNLDDAFLKFESKYIRDEQTAIKLRNYLLEWFKNQHNIIECTLPVDYMALECGDIVQFDSLIQDTKIFGKDYTQSYLIDTSPYSQVILNQFAVQEITKSQNNVKVKLIQLHEINYAHIEEDYSLSGEYTDFYIEPEIDTGDGETTEVLLGDADLDGSTSILDIVLIVNHVLDNNLLEGINLLAADINQDGLLNVLDVVTITQVIVGNQEHPGTIEV